MRGEKSILCYFKLLKLIHQKNKIIDRIIFENYIRIVKFAVR